MLNDPRVVDFTGALALKEVPKSMLILSSVIDGARLMWRTAAARMCHLLGRKFKA